MYAIIEAGSKQFKVEKDSVIKVERFGIKDRQDEVRLNKVLFAKEGNSFHVGSPYIKGASVTCKVLGLMKEPKVVAYKYKRRKSEKKKRGHRQEMVRLKVKSIEIGG